MTTSDILNHRLEASRNTPTASRRRSFAALNAPVPLALLSLVLVSGMVLAFYAVVSQAVRDSELRRNAAAAQAKEVGRCKLLSSLPERDSCLQQLAAPN